MWAELRTVMVRFKALLGRRRRDTDFDEEIQNHLALLQERFMQQGMAREEARLAARRAFGGIDQSKEAHRDARSFVWIERLLSDISYSARNLARNPGFTLFVVLALTLGIGANATVFALYNAVGMKRLPVADAERVVRIKRSLQGIEDRGDETLYNFSFEEYRHLREHSASFNGVVAQTPADYEKKVLVSIPGQLGPINVIGTAASANYFAELGVAPVLGRSFATDENETVPNPVVVLGYSFWQRKLQGERNVVGRVMKINGLDYTIIGVTPQRFTGADIFPVEPAFWAPLSMREQLNPGSYPAVNILARLKPDVSRATAQAEVAGLMQNYLTEFRKHSTEVRRTIGITLQENAYPVISDGPGLRVIGGMLLMLVSLVLIAACANAANMLLARNASRQREIGIRMALGASRGQIIRQLLIESVMLALSGGTVGFVASIWTGKLLWLSVTRLISLAVLSGNNALAELDFSPDRYVLLYGAALSLVTGLLFGLAPALQSTRRDPNAAIRQNSLLSAFGRSRLRGLMLGTQVAVSVMLLLGSNDMISRLVGSLVRTPDSGEYLRRAYSVERTRHQTDGQDGGTSQLDDADRLIRASIETLPELSSVSFGSRPFWDTIHYRFASGAKSKRITTSYASDGYFETLGIRVVRGRGFTRQESYRGMTPAVISESAARYFWAGEDPIGKRVSVDLTIIKKQFTAFEIVGVVADSDVDSLTESDLSHVYLPIGGPSAAGLEWTALFRTRQSPDRALAAVHSALNPLDRSVVKVEDIVSLEDGTIGLVRGLVRFQGTFAAILCLLTMLLAVSGVYGVTMFLVSQRSKDIAIRLALGATLYSIVRNIAAELWSVFIGLLCGFVVSVGVVSLMRRALPVIPLNPPGAFSTVFLSPSSYIELTLVFAIAMLAIIIPVTRALRGDPIAALRCE